MNDIRTNSIKAWILASRPKTLTGAAVPVIIALAMAYEANPRAFFLSPAILCLLFAFVMQIAANFINDYFDFIRGNDDETRLGPLRACAQGWITKKAMKIGIIITMVVACFIGMPLIYYGGWEMILVGAICVVFCFLYTTKLSYIGMGDLLVLIFFGLVPVCVTYYIETKCVTLDVIVASLACGMVIDTLLIVNNYRDIDNDKRSEKITLIVKIGAERGKLLYLWIGIVACLIGSVHIVYNNTWAFVLPTLIYTVLHFITYREMCRINKGKALNEILGKTARNIFIYGLLSAIGFLF